MRQRFNAITGRFHGRQRELRCNISVAPFDGTNKYTGKIYSGIWDTGATNSAISSKVVEELGLMPTGIVTTSTANGLRDSMVYDVEVRILDNIKKIVSVTEADLNGADALIGMDIIGDGDFAVSYDNLNGEMCVSYRTPSQGKIDFVEQANANRTIRRNNAKKNKIERRNKKIGRKHNK